jgi:hypothetical protein
MSGVISTKAVPHSLLDQQVNGNGAIERLRFAAGVPLSTVPPSRLLQRLAQSLEFRRGDLVPGGSKSANSI